MRAHIIFYGNDDYMSKQSNDPLIQAKEEFCYSPQFMPKACILPYNSE